MRRVASATRCGSSASRAKGLAVVTAQKPQARVQRSPAIIKVAVPLLQHSQWFGHRALSQTVCRFSSSSNERVRAKLSLVGRGRRSHAGKRGRGNAGGLTGFVEAGATLFRNRARENRIPTPHPATSLLHHPIFLHPSALFLESPPEILQLVGPEISENLSIYIDHRGKFLA